MVSIAAFHAVDPGFNAPLLQGFNICRSIEIPCYHKDAFKTAKYYRLHCQCNGGIMVSTEHSCLPSSSSGFDTRPSHCFLFYYKKNKYIYFRKPPRRLRLYLVPLALVHASKPDKATDQRPLLGAVLAPDVSHPPARALVVGVFE
jgi:hypothetical protein